MIKNYFCILVSFFVGCIEVFATNRPPLPQTPAPSATDDECPELTPDNVRILLARSQDTINGVEWRVLGRGPTGMSRPSQAANMSNQTENSLISVTRENVMETKSASTLPGDETMVWCQYNLEYQDHSTGKVTIYRLKN
jgi:hypothetical protein